mgnify:CR=1 FL=1
MVKNKIKKDPLIKMVKSKKRVLGVAGIIVSSLGLILLIPTALKGNIITGSISGALVMTGIILFSISFSDEYLEI